MGEVVVFEIIDFVVVLEEFNGNVVLGVIDVVVFLNACLMLVKVVGIDFEDIDNEGFLDIFKVERIFDVEIDDVVIIFLDIRSV